ncbi:hypothetical protein V6N11_069156 [Hibiscus sabdariffa]|uniref:Uncharacterized protein n=1 Tax=Hibiscus sabdariffa TaxID=183260 RepID=A0ABR1ZZQ1_9ROSI
MEEWSKVLSVDGEGCGSMEEMSIGDSDEGCKAMVEGFCVVDDEYGARVRSSRGNFVRADLVKVMAVNPGCRTVEVVVRQELAVA